MATRITRVVDLVVTVFACTVCRREFAQEAEAEACEKKHHKEHHVSAAMMNPYEANMNQPRLVVRDRSREGPELEFRTWDEVASYALKQSERETAVRDLHERIRNVRQVTRHWRRGR